MTPKVIVRPTSEPITLDEAAFNLGVDDDGNSPATYPATTAARIRGLIRAARESCEQELERALAPQTLEVALDRFPCHEIELPWPPLISVTSVKYLDVDGNLQTISDTLYATDGYQGDAWLLPAYGESWPSTRAVINAVTVRYRAGYDTPGNSPEFSPIPYPIIEAMHLLIAHGWKNREAVDDGRFAELPLGVRSKLWPYRRGVGV